MTLRFVILFICVVLSTLSGDEEQLQVRFLQSMTDSTPGQTRSVQVLITNQSCRDIILVGHLKLPEGWEAVPANDILTHLSRGQRFIQTLMFNVPEGEVEGTYRIEYEVTSRNNINRQGWDRTFVIVRNPDQTESCECGKEEQVVSSDFEEDYSQFSIETSETENFTDTLIEHIIPVLEEPLNDILETVTDRILMTVTSPVRVQASQGQVIYISGLLKNQSDEERRGQVELALPEGWQAVVVGDTDVVLPPQGTSLKIFGVKVSNQALAGDHVLVFKTEGVASNHREIKVSVLPKVDFVAEIDDRDDSYVLEDTVETKVLCINRGNVALRLRVEAKADPDCTIQYSSRPFEVLPNESHSFAFRLNPRMNEDEECRQFVLFKIFDADSGQLLHSNTVCMKLLPHGKSKSEDEFVRIPSHVTMMALGDNGTNVFAVEVAGEGVIDVTRDRYFEYFFRLPTDSRNVIYNLDQVVFVGVSEPDWELRLGDSVYDLTPLTQRYRYGRGGGIDLGRGKWWVGAHYTQNTYNNDYNPHETCVYLEYEPTERFSISGNYMHKTLQRIPTSNILTVESEIEFPSKVYTEVEYGNDFVDNPFHLDTYAYRVETRGQCFKDTWFDIEKVFAGPSFFGYYNNLKQFSSSLDFPLARRMRANVSMNRYEQNYDQTIEDLYYCGISPNQRQYNANVSYNFSDGSALIFNGLLLRSRDASDHYQFNFYQKWGGFTYFKAFNRCIFNTIVSFGQQKDYLTGHTTHFLQQYYVFLSKNISPNLIGSIFYDGGNINYYDAKPWRKSFGGSLSYQYSPRGNVDLFLQRVSHSHDAYEMSQVSVNFNHTFRNHHFLRVSGQYFYYHQHYHNDAFFLVSYTIPFDLPFGKRKDIGSVEGYVHDESGYSPVEQAMVNCNGAKAVSDPSGYFAFTGLPVGRHQLKSEILPNNLITKDNQPLVADVRGGKKTRITLPVVAACSIKGEIIQYAFEDLFRQMQLPEDQRNKLIMRGGLVGIRVTISLDDGKEIYTCLTDSRGGFSFNKLRPGNWTIEVNTNHLPALHYLNMNELTFEVEPGENKNITFSVLPQEPKLYKLD